MLRAKHVPPGTAFVVRDVIDGEVRNTFYVRDSDGACVYPQNVKVARLGIAQMRADGEYRLCIALDKPCRDPGEMHGLTVVELESDFPAEDLAGWFPSLPHPQENADENCNRPVA